MLMSFLGLYRKDFSKLQLDFFYLDLKLPIMYRKPIQVKTVAFGQMTPC